MKPTALILITLTTILFVGCDSKTYEQLKKEEDIALLAAKKIVQNRATYSKEIIAATNDCIKAATSVQTLAAASNDQAETVEECKEAAQEAYGAKSPYSEDWLAQAAIR